MQSILPYELSGANAYYTGFDPRIIQFKRDKESLQTKIEQELKCLLLTKNNIVCAASHLTTPFALHFFKKNSLLLNSGVIIPALRSDLEDFYDLMYSEKSHSKKQRDDYVRFYNDNIRKVIRWELRDTSEKFRDWYLNELMTPNSVLRMNLKDIDSQQLNDVIRNIQNQDIFSRSKIDNLSIEFSRTTRKTMRDFRELIYHVTGAKVLNCESVIPQQQYLDYSNNDIRNEKICISPNTIFIKFFLENIYNSIFENVFPTVVLDLLTFEDIFAIREIINKSNFIEKYSRLTHASTCILGKSLDDSLLVGINEILKIREELQINFSEEIEKELRIIRKRKIMRSMGAFVHNSAAILSSLLSFGSAHIGLFSLALTAKDAIPSIFSNIYSISYLSNMSNVMKGQVDRQEMLLKKIKKMYIKNNTELCDTVNLLNEIIKMRLENCIKC